MVGERFRNALDREPVWRRVEGMIDDTFHSARNAPGEMLQKRVPQFPNRNFGGGVTVGAVEAVIAIVLKDTVGLPFGSDVEIVDSEPRDNGTLYTVNVDAPFENMARAQAFIESGTGFTSLLTDLLDVRSSEVIKTRTIRDTYQVKVLVQD